MRGRRPKSEAEKRLAGNPGKRRLTARAPEPKPEPKPEDEKPADAYAAPGRLSADARDVWSREMPRLRDLNLLKPTDLASFEVYCQVAGRHAKASRVIDEKGLSYVSESKHGSFERVRPEVKIVEVAERTMRALMGELGMTSASRIRALSTLMSSKQLPLPLEPTTPKPSAEASPAPAAAGPQSPIGYLN